MVLSVVLVMLSVAYSCVLTAWIDMLAITTVQCKKHIPSLVRAVGSGLGRSAAPADAQ